MKTFAIGCALAACAAVLGACDRSAAPPLPHVEH